MAKGKPKLLTTTTEALSASDRQFFFAAKIAGFVALMLLTILVNYSAIE